MEPYIGCTQYGYLRMNEHSFATVHRDAIMCRYYILSQIHYFTCGYKGHAIQKDADVLLMHGCFHHVKVRSVLLATSSLSKRHCQISM